jgi:hypothetical protein
VIKFIYYAKRKPSWTAETFPPRWRQHGALAMSMPSWRNMLLYIQADAVRPPPLVGLSSDFDGFCYAFTRSQGLFNPGSPEDQANTQRVLNDELETFEGPIRPVLLFVDEEVLIEGPPGGVTAGLAFNDPARAAAVANHYAGRPGSARVVLNRVREDMSIVALSVPYRAVVEIAAADEQALVSVLGAEGRWREADVAVVARENVLWDEISGRPS